MVKARRVGEPARADRVRDRDERITTVTSTVSRPTVACGAALLSLGLVACGGSTATSPGTAATAPDSAVATAPPADDATAGATADEDDADDTDDTDDTDGTATAEAGAKVSASTASEDEIAQALTAAGVSNPGRWVEEVVEYRPYPSDDPDLGKLRQNLAKYNPGEETTNKIVAALTP